VRQQWSLCSTHFDLSSGASFEAWTTPPPL